MRKGRAPWPPVRHAGEQRGHLFSFSGKPLIGNVGGNTNAFADFSEIWRLYRAGQLQLSGMITKTYPLSAINDGYADLFAGD